MKLNNHERKIIEILKKNPFVNQQFIANELSLSRPAVANMISGLQDKGYILGKPYLLRTEKYITCVGGANLDYIFRLEQELMMKTSNPVISSKSYGGVIRNVAENLARLNHKVSLISVIGDDLAGQDLIEHSRKLMEVFAVDQLPYEKTGGYYSLINTNGDLDIGFADMSINRLMNRTWVFNHKRDLILSDWIICDTNVAKDGLEALIEFSRNESIKLAIIGVSGPKMKHLPLDLKLVDVLICNADETQSYFQTDTLNLETLCQLWLDKGIKKVIVTKGKDGCVHGEDKSIHYRPSIDVKEESIKDVTGAGDAFSAALMHGLISGEDLATSVLFGTRSAAYTIQSTSSVNPNLSISLLKKEIN